MASEDILAALLGGGSTDPLASFQKATASNNMLKMAAAPVLGAKFDNSTWTPLETFGTSAAQAFLGTFLQGLGQRREDEQLMKVASIYPELLKDPLSVAVPEGVDSNAFNALKLGQLQKNAALEAAREQKRQDLKDALLLKFADKPYSPGGKVALSALGLDSVVGDLFKSSEGAIDPEDPAYKIRADKLKEIQAMGDAQARIEQLDPVKTYQQVLPVYERMGALINSGDKASDPLFKSAYGKFIDTIGAMSDAQINQAGLTRSFADSILGDWESNIKGTSALDLPTKQKMMASVHASLIPFGETANSVIARQNDPYVTAGIKAPFKLFELPKLEQSEAIKRIASDPLTGESLTDKAPSWMPKNQAAQAELAVKLKEIEKEANKYPVGSAEREQIFNLAKQLVEGRKPQVAGSPIG